MGNRGSNDVYMNRHSARADKARNWSPLEGFSRDDSECSDQGIDASQELAAFLQRFQIDHIVSSPFYRCVQTVLPVSKRHKIKIKVEPGICEILSTFPPGFQETTQLAGKFGEDMIDLDYKPVMLRNQFSPEYGDSTAAKRSMQVARKIRDVLDGPILFCGHGASCLGILKALHHQSIDRIHFNPFYLFLFDFATSHCENYEPHEDLKHAFPENKALIYSYFNDKEIRQKK